MLLYVIHYVVRDISASTDIAYLLDKVMDKGHRITVILSLYFFGSFN